MSVFSNLIVGKKESVLDELLLLNPIQIPLITALGGFGKPVHNTQHEWNEDAMYGFKANIPGELAEAATSLTVEAADKEKFRVGQVIQIEDELMLITSIHATDPILTITRGYAGTTDIIHAAGSQVDVNFNLSEEGADARDTRYKARENKFNYTQIFDDSVQVTGTAAEVAQYGIDNIYEIEKQKKIVELALQLEKACINGFRYQSGNYRYFNGIKRWITTNIINASSADITKKMLNDAVQNVADNAGLGGGRYVMMVSPLQRRKIGVLDANSLIIERSDTRRGEIVKSVITDLGEFPVVVNPNLMSDELIFTDLNRMSIRPLGSREFSHEYLGKQGDYFKGTILGEYTFEFKEEKAHSRVIGLKTSW
jgi:hypothetical protein